MATRHADWFEQARRDLDHARHSLSDGDYEWACFAAQQGAEKAVKAVYQKLGGDAWGHAVAVLLHGLPGPTRPPVALIDAAKELDKHYIPARYPDAHPAGAPHDSYTEGEARRAIENAERIVEFCANLLA